MAVYPKHPLIPAHRHSSNLDRTAVLMNGPHNGGRDIYRVRGGFLAFMGEMVFAGLFPTQADAEKAQREWA